MRQILQRTPKVFNSTNQSPKKAKTLDIDFGSFRPIIILILLTATVFVVRDLPVFRLQSIEIQGDKDQKVEERLNSLKGTSVFSGRLSLSVRKIKNDIPRIDDLRCKLGLPNSLKCHLSVKQAAVYWINQASGKIFAVDKYGFIFETVPVLPEKETPVIDNSAKEPQIGERILSDAIINDLNLLKKLLETAQVKYTSLRTQSLSDLIIIEINSFVIDNQLFTKNLTVLVSRGHSLENQIISLEAILKNKHQQINRSIDLRVPGIAYYQ